MADLAPRRWSGQRAGAVAPGDGARPRAACSPHGQRRRERGLQCPAPAPGRGPPAPRAARGGGRGLQRPAAAPGRGPPAPHTGTREGRQGQQHPGGARGRGRALAQQRERRLRTGRGNHRLQAPGPPHARALAQRAVCAHWNCITPPSVVIVAACLAKGSRGRHRPQAQCDGWRGCGLGGDGEEERESDGREKGRASVAGQ